MKRSKRRFISLIFLQSLHPENFEGKLWDKNIIQSGFKFRHHVGQAKKAFFLCWGALLVCLV